MNNPTQAALILRGQLIRLDQKCAHMGAGQDERNAARDELEALPARNREAYLTALPGAEVEAKHKDGLDTWMDLAKARRDLNRAYRLLYSGLDGMLSSHRLTEADIPDDYKRLIVAMNRVAECRAEIGA